MHERPMYVGGTGLTWGLGTVLGPIIGGAFTVSSAGWRWAFYINLCIGAACAPVYLFMLPNKDPRPGVSFMDRAREMDYVGTVLTLGAFVSGVLAMSFGGVTYPWNSGRIIGLFVCSGVLFILLGIQQVYSKLNHYPPRLNDLNNLANNLCSHLHYDLTPYLPSRVLQITHYSHPFCDDCSWRNRGLHTNLHDSHLLSIYAQ